MFFRVIPTMDEDDRGTKCAVFAVWSEEHSPEMLAMLLGCQDASSYVISDFSVFSKDAHGFLGAVFPEDYEKIASVLADLGFANKTDQDTLDNIRAQAEEMKDTVRTDPKPCIKFH